MARARCAKKCHWDFNHDGQTSQNSSWGKVPASILSFSCQQCHMPEKEDGTHEPHFAGVDLNYEFPAEEDSLYYDVLNLIQGQEYLSYI